MFFLEVGSLAKWWRFLNECSPPLLASGFSLQSLFLQSHFFIWVLRLSFLFLHSVVLLVSKFRTLVSFIVRLIPLAMAFLVVAFCLQSCHNIGRFFGGVLLPAVFRASPQKHFSRRLVFSASHAV